MPCSGLGGCILPRITALQDARCPGTLVTGRRYRLILDSRYDFAKPLNTRIAITGCYRMVSVRAVTAPVPVAFTAPTYRG